MINKTTYWILVANSTEARCYKTHRLDGKIELVRPFQHPQAREPIHDLVSDKQGRYMGNSFHPTSAEPRTDPREVEMEKFAHEIANALDHDNRTHQFDKLIIIAPAHFHGLLTQYCNKHVLARVLHHVDKDYTKLTDKELEAHLAELSK